MWKMLPIPAPLIDSTSLANSYSVRQHQRFFLPLIYLGATASLCYLFLFALVISNETPHQSGRERGIWHQLALVGHNSEKLFYSQREQRKRQDHSLRDLVHNSSENSIQRTPNRENSQLVLSSSTSTLSSSRTQPLVAVGRKTLYSLRRKERSHSKNGTWRSHSSQIRLGHQDLGPTTLSILQPKGYKHSSKPAAHTGVYYYPWRKDEQCKTYNVHFAEKNTFKPRALVSFPGSGNSWLRYLIENASGYFTGSVYNDKQLYNSGLLGELRSPNDGTTIVQKTHHNVAGTTKNIKGYVKLSELMFGYRGILIIRNPYEALVSFRNYLKSKTYNRHTGIARNNEFSGEEWTTFVTTYIPLWSSLIMTWIENSQDYLIVLYENVRKNPREELIRILEYLDQPVDTARLDCLMKKENLEGPFHRAHRQTEKTSDDPLSLDSIPSTTSTSTTSQKDTKIRFKQQPPKLESSSLEHQLRNDEHPLLQLDSKKSQQPRQQQQHLQSQSPPKRTTTPIGRGTEQKEDKFLSSPLSFQAISSTNSLQQQQNQYTSNMTSGSSASSGTPTAMNNTTTTYSLTDDNQNDHDNNRLNKGSILRLDLIIQDNIDKINRFFQHKSIPVQLHYSLRPSTIPYFLHTYIVNASTPTSLFSL